MTVDEVQCVAEEIVIRMSQGMTIVVDLARELGLEKEQYMILAESCWVARERGLSFEQVAETLRRGGYGR